MKLYDIGKEIESLIDPETGEIADFEAFVALQMERETKIENTALYIKNLKAEADAIRAEEKNLADRRKAAEAKAERLTEYLNRALNGEKFQTARCVCSYRKTQKVELMEGFVEWARNHADDLLTFDEPKPNKTKIKEAIKAGRDPWGAALVDGYSFSVK